MAEPTRLRAAPGGMTDAEWAVRVDLAACYQLVDLHGWSDMSSTHISARVPGTDHFLFNPYGVMFGDITASMLIKVDQAGTVLSETTYPFNPAAFVIHSAIHGGRADAHCVMHTHTRAGIAVACQADGLLPLTQKGMILAGFVAYHDYEGLVLDDGEKARLVEHLGDKQVLIMRNHGLMTVGSTVAAAFAWMHRTEMACRYQIDAMTGGARLHLPTPEVRQRTREQGLRILGPNGHARSGFEWPGLLKQLERERGMSYRT